VGRRKGCVKKKGEINNLFPVGGVKKSHQGGIFVQQFLD